MEINCTATAGKWVSVETVVKGPDHDLASRVDDLERVTEDCGAVWCFHNLWNIVVVVTVPRWADYGLHGQVHGRLHRHLN